MEKEFGTDPEKMLDWNKKLGEQSDYVSKAIVDHNPKNAKIDLINNFEVSDLFDRLSNEGVFKGDEFPVVEILKSIGIEGCIHHDRTDVYNDEYLKELNIIHENHFKYNWYDTENFDGKLEDFIGEYLVFDMGKDNHNLDSYFVVGHVNEPPNPDKPDVLHTKIMFFQTEGDIEDHKPIFYINTNNLDIDTAKNIIEKTTEHFSKLEDYKFSDMKEHIIKQFPERTVILEEYPKNQQFSDRQLETANKTGYVQGVCESVLAFNTEENRKIMSESTMSFLSKKLLAEMNVTKDMAQKFANPETYKALEKCVFSPAQEQHLEQNQSQGIRR